ncbi:hypothetical protein ABH310_15530, partial [Chromobacterium piscinae]
MPHIAHHIEKSADILLRRLPGQHHCGVRQVGHAGEGVAGRGEQAQIRQRRVMRIGAEIDGGVRIDRRAVAIGQVVGALALFFRREHVLELHLVAAADAERRQQDAVDIAEQAIIQHRQAQAGLGAAQSAGVEVQALHEQFIDADVQTGSGGLLLAGVTEFQIQRNAAAAPGEQVPRHAERHAYRRRLLARGLQIARIVHQLAQLGGPIRPHPVRRVVRLARRVQLHSAHHHLGAAHPGLAQHQRVGGQLQVLVVAAQNQQQLALRPLRVRHDADGGHRHRRQLGQKVRPLGVGGINDGVLRGRQAVERGGVAHTAPPSLGAEPRRQLARGLQ